MVWQHLVRRAGGAARRIRSRILAPSGAQQARSAEFRRQRLCDLVGPGAWNVDRASVSGTECAFSGWVFTPDHPPSALTIFANDTRIADATLGLPRSDLARLEPVIPNAAGGGFTCRVPCASTDRELRLEIGLHGGQRIDGLPPSFVRLVDDTLPVPDPARMRRVHGDADPGPFRMAGYDRFRKLEEAFTQVSGHGFESGMRILDWGCGSGRLARYFTDRPGVSLTGVDVDADNIGWCSANLPVGAFTAIPLHPPTQLPDAAFDLVLGVSVFTHLTEHVQFEWLRELQRITRPGGHLLLSVHANAVLAQQPALADSAWEQWERRGFVDGHSPDMDGVLPEAGYYRTTLHHPSYIEREWTKYFDLLMFLEGYLGIQALCVLRRRPGSAGPS